LYLTKPYPSAQKKNKKQNKSANSSYSASRARAMELEEEEQEMELATMQEEGDAIMIPVRDSEELVRVNLDELPKDAEEIIEILKAEFAPLDIWLKFAVCTHKRSDSANLFHSWSITRGAR